MRACNSCNKITVLALILSSVASNDRLYPQRLAGAIYQRLI
nr:MAG TPA: hypothetical protein [Bacteriophage sp.]